MNIQEKNISGIRVIEVNFDNGELLFRAAPDYGAKVMELNFIIKQ